MNEWVNDCNIKCFGVLGLDKEQCKFKPFTIFLLLILCLKTRTNNVFSESYFSLNMFAACLLCNRN